MAETKIHRARNGKIDFLRLLFAFIIVLHHTRYLLGDDHCLFLGGSLSVEFGRPAEKRRHLRKDSAPKRRISLKRNSQQFLRIF